MLVETFLGKNNASIIKNEHCTIMGSSCFFIVYEQHWSPGWLGLVRHNEKASMWQDGYTSFATEVRLKLNLRINANCHVLIGKNAPAGHLEDNTIFDD